MGILGKGDFLGKPSESLFFLRWETDSVFGEPSDSPHVAWGDFSHFIAYTAKLELVHAIGNNSTTGLGFHLC